MSDTFLKFAETNSLLAVRKDLLPLVLVGQAHWHCLQQQEWRWACREASQRSTGPSELRLFTEWPVAKKKEVLNSLCSPLLCCPRENQSKNCPLELSSVWKNKQTPLQWESGTSVKPRTALWEGDGRRASSQSQFLTFFYPTHQILFLTMSIFLSPNNKMLWASFKQ